VINYTELSTEAARGTLRRDKYLVLYKYHPEVPPKKGRVPPKRYPLKCAEYPHSWYVHWEKKMGQFDSLDESNSRTKNYIH